MSPIDISHPRYRSLTLRETLVDGCKNGITSISGLIAHGRGEAFDYLIGERSTTNALDATKVASAHLLTAQYPVISVNGNTAALVPNELVELSEIIGAPLEINLFHRSNKRITAIEQHLKGYGARRILTGKDFAILPNIVSERAKIDKRGIFLADVIFVPLEDGDRCQALRSYDKTVLVVDLNPFSRSAIAASVTIVDELTRTMTNLIKVTKTMRNIEEQEQFRYLKSTFSNTENLKKSYLAILSRLKEQCEQNQFF